MTAYTTKDSGVRTAYDSGMVRDTNKGKARFDLCRPRGLPYDEQMLTRFAMLMMRGAEKYGDRNWEQGDGQAELDRARESAERHLNQWLAGLDDEDHAAAVFFNVMAAEYFKWRIALADIHRRWEDAQGQPPKPFDITGLATSIEFTLDPEYSANLARLFAAEPTAHVAPPCRACGFTHPEADCPRWPAREDPADEDEDPDRPVDYWPAYMSPHRVPPQVEVRDVSAADFDEADRIAFGRRPGEDVT